MGAKFKPIYIDWPVLGKPFTLPATIKCKGGVLRSWGVNRYGRAIYCGRVQNGYVHIGFEVLSATHGENLDIFIGRTKAELDEEGYLDPINGTEGKFALNTIPAQVQFGLDWMNKKGYL